MSWASGETINTQARFRRLSQSIPSSYTVWKDTSTTPATYRAETNIAGGTDHKGLDAGAVIEAAVEALPSVGGVVLIRAGVYDCLTPTVFTNKYNFILKGEGRGGIQSSNVGILGQTVLNKKFNGDLLTVNYSSAASGKNSFGIENLALRTNYVDAVPTTVDHTGRGLVISKGGFFWVDNVTVAGMTGNCVDIRSSSHHRLQNVFVTGVTTGHGIYYDDCYDWQWYYVEADANKQDTGYSAVNLSSSHGDILGGHFEGWRCLTVVPGGASSNIRVTGAFMPWAKERNVYSESWLSLANCRIDEANVDSAYSGVEASNVYATADNTRVTGCYIGMPGGTAEYSAYFTGHSNMILGNTLLHKTHLGSYRNHFLGNQVGEAAVVGNVEKNYIIGNNFIDTFNLWAGAVNNIITDNEFQSTVTIQNWGNKIRGNIGLVTENTGTSTGTGVQQTIAHGCAFTPTTAHVLLTDIEDGAAPYCSAAPDAANIYITAVVNQDYRWEVKLFP